MLSCSSCDQLFVTVACQALLSMGFSRKEYCSGLPFPPRGDLPNPGIKPSLLHLLLWLGYLNGGGGAPIYKGQISDFLEKYGRSDNTGPLSAGAK